MYMFNMDSYFMKDCYIWFATYVRPEERQIAGNLRKILQLFH